MYNNELLRMNKLLFWLGRKFQADVIAEKYEKNYKLKYFLKIFQ